MIIPKIPYANTSNIPGPDLRTIAKDPQEHLEDPTKQALKYYTRGMRAQGLPCVICGTDENVEMHHIRKMQDLKGESPLNIALRGVKRKQIPLCRKHHLEAHGKVLKT